VQVTQQTGWRIRIQSIAVSKTTFFSVHSFFSNSSVFACWHFSNLDLKCSFKKYLFSSCMCLNVWHRKCQVWLQGSLQAPWQPFKKVIFLFSFEEPLLFGSGSGSAFIKMMRLPSLRNTVLKHFENSLLQNL
jgi:hypothetical protein